MLFNRYAKFSLMRELNFSPFPTLISTRIVLRNLETRDAGLIFNYQSNKDNFPHAHMPIYTDPSQAENYIIKMNKGVNEKKWIIWAIADINSNIILGTISIWNLNLE